MNGASKTFVVVAALCAAAFSVVASTVVLPLVIPWHFGGSAPVEDTAHVSNVRVSDLLYSTRQVATRITRTLYVEEWKQVLGMQELPLAMRQAVAADNTLTWPVADNSQDPTLGLLWGDYVITTTYTINRHLANAPTFTWSQYKIELRLLPKAGEENPAYSEVILHIAADTLLRIPTARAYSIDFAKGLGVFERQELPAYRRFATPSGAPYTLGTLNDMQPLQEAYVLHGVLRLMGPEKVSYTGKAVVDIQGTTMHYLLGAFHEQDLGGPVFRVAKDGSIQVVGIVMDSGALARHYGKGVAIDITDFLNSIPIQLPR